MESVPMARHGIIRRRVLPSDWLHTRLRRDSIHHFVMMPYRRQTADVRERAIVFTYKNEAIASLFFIQSNWLGFSISVHWTQHHLSRGQLDFEYSMNIIVFGDTNEWYSGVAPNDVLRKDVDLRLMMLPFARTESWMILLEIIRLLCYNNGGKDGEF